MRRTTARSFAAALALALPLAVATPRAAAAQRSMSSRDEPSRVISINPLGLLFAYFSLEYEQALSGNSSGGLAATYWDSRNDEQDKTDLRYFLLDGKFRLYPGEHAPGGWSIGLTAGYAHITDKDLGCSQTNCDGVKTSENALSTGLELDYTRLYGRSKGFAVSGGLGARRLYPFGGEIEHANKVVGIFRFSIGRAF